jgi:gamma-glutamyl-gamma-aminobutyrate hydrolase PuuD
MTSFLKVAVSQRIDEKINLWEERDSLDHRIYQWLNAAECLSFPVPNVANSFFMDGHIQESFSWLHIIKPDAILLSGGNDIGAKPRRDRTESALLSYAAKIGLPVLGICRGMQMMAVWSGGSLLPVIDHVGKRHRIQTAVGSGDWPMEVNSFHNYALAECPPDFSVAAYSEDKSIEAICHKTLRWEGWMWHPEREPEFNRIDLARFRSLICYKNEI